MIVKYSPKVGKVRKSESKIFLSNYRTLISITNKYRNFMTKYQLMSMNHEPLAMN